MRTYAERPVRPELESVKVRIDALIDVYEKAVAAVLETKDNEYIDFHARRMVEMAGYIIMSYLLLEAADQEEEYFTKSANVYAYYTESEVNKNASFIMNFKKEDLKFYQYKEEKAEVEA